MRTRHFTDEDKAKAAERELKMRKRVYPRWVQDGRMSQAEADRQIQIMDEIAGDYREAGALPL